MTVYYYLLTYLLVGGLLAASMALIFVGLTGQPIPRPVALLFGCMFFAVLCDLIHWSVTGR